MALKADHSMGRIRELETSRHLFQRPLYRDPSGAWKSDLPGALDGCGSQVHLDIAAVASFLSFGMVGEQRTLLREISRRPWMSRVSETGEPLLEPLPPHGFFTGPDDAMAERLYLLLCDEARAACDGYSEIYILLSGGLDSRIIAGVLSRLYQAGEIVAKPVAVTWGLADSRDVVYAKRMAAILGLEWLHVEFGPETVLENIDTTARHLGLLHSPEMLHAMSWFRNVPESSLVIAGSFGDSIGRAEFAGLRLLQLRPQKPNNTYGILEPAAFQAACADLQRDLDAIHSRGGPDRLPYAQNEYWMQGFRMRGGLCHALTIINRYARVYQMFTAPEVFGFVWSLHPTRRNDDIYAALLEKRLPSLAGIPWPRTNRALRGPTDGARGDLRAHYHEYTKWSSGPLCAELSRRVDPEWFEAIGIFDARSIQSLAALVRSSRERVGRLNDVWLWLAGFRCFAEGLAKVGKTLVIEASPKDKIPDRSRKRPGLRAIAVLAASKSPTLNRVLKDLRAHKRRRELARLTKQAIRDYPPSPYDSEAPQ